MTDRIQLGELAGIDGPTWNYANRQLGIYWNSRGGDIEGAEVQYKPKVASGPVAIDVTEIASRLVGDNTGIRIRTLPTATGTMPTPPKWWTKTAIDNGQLVTANAATLAVVTDQGSFVCPCDRDCFIDPMANQTIDGDDGTASQSVALFRFDMSAVKGTIKSATLNAVIRRYGGANLGVGFLGMPLLIADPIHQYPSKIRAGIAAQFDNDADLRMYKSVINYVECKSVPDVVAQFNGVSTNYSTVNGVSIGCYDPTFIVSDLGLPAMQLVSRSLQNLPVPSTPESGCAIANMYAFTTPTPKKLSYERPYGSGPEDVYMRYLIKTHLDVLDGMVETGIKLPGLDGGFYDQTSGVPAGNGFSARMEHGLPSKSNPLLAAFLTYWYGVDKKDGVAGTTYRTEIGVRDNTGDRGGAMQSIACYRVGKTNCLEQHVKLNTFSADGTPNKDAVVEMWLDGYLIYRETGFAARGIPGAQVHEVPWFEMMHGGTKPPVSPITFEVSGIVAASEYIGPPKAMLAAIASPQPSPDQSPPTGNSMDINTVIADITTALNDAYAVAGQPSVAQQLADAQTALATANANLATANGTVSTLQAQIATIKAKAATLNTADAAENAALADLVANLPA